MTPTYARITYKGQTFDYETLAQLFDFVVEVDNADVIEDGASIERTVEFLDRGAKPAPPERYFA